MQRGKLAIALLLALIASVATASVASGAALGPQATSQKLQRAVTVDGILRHEKALQQIANDNDGNRASGTPGYTATRKYVAQKLNQAGYNVRIQPFTYRQFSEDSPTTLAQTAPDATTYTDGEDFAIMSYSGSGDVPDALVEAVDTDTSASGSSTSGCEATDFTGFTDGNIALMQRGTCPFAQKAQNAEDAGASAALIFNNGADGNTGVLFGTLGEDAGVGIPTLGLDFETGQDLADPDTTQASVSADTSNKKVKTTNVIANLPGGLDKRTIVSGAHLDSVPEGPGINDDGSGTATTLELAIQTARQDINARNHLRFVFFGAEEEGLLGSQAYVDSLSPKAKDNIAAYLNYDMLGSPNFVRFVYDGDGSSEQSDRGPNGSAKIERVYNNFFASKNQKTDPTAFDGRSDYGPFIAEGIPAGGLFSGAEGIKTERQQKIYGGKAGNAYDECYHQSCDNIRNLNRRALNQFSNAAAHAEGIFAQTKKPIRDNNTSRSTQKQSSDETPLYRGDTLQR